MSACRVATHNDAVVSPRHGTLRRAHKQYLLQGLISNDLSGNGFTVLEGTDLTFVGWVMTVLGVLPLVLAQLALGWPRTWTWLRTHTADQLSTQLSWGTALPVACYILAGLAVGRFDPYATAVMLATCMVVIGALTQGRSGSSRPTWSDAAIWLMLWIPFDLRWTSELWRGPKELDYSWWAVGLTVVGVYGFGVIRDLPGLGYGLIPQRRDFAIALAALGALATIAIPVGLATSLLRFPPTTELGFLAVILRFIVLFLTVAIPEELFFRGLLQNGLSKWLHNPRLGLLLASCAFGLVHWNNRPDVSEAVAYIGLAATAGLFYGWAYQRSGRLFAPILCHTMVDLIWHFGFH